MESDCREKAQQSLNIAMRTSFANHCQPVPPIPLHRVGYSLNSLRVEDFPISCLGGKMAQARLQVDSNSRSLESSHVQGRRAGWDWSRAAGTFCADEIVPPVRSEGTPPGSTRKRYICSVTDEGNCSRGSRHGTRK